MGSETEFPVESHPHIEDPHPRHGSGCSQKAEFPDPTNSLMLKAPLLQPLSAILSAHTHLPDQAAGSLQAGPVSYTSISISRALQSIQGTVSVVSVQ